MSNISPSGIRAEITPITLQEPTPQQIIQQARATGMTVGGDFPIASGTRYQVWFFDIDENAETDTLQTSFESVENVNNAFYVGEHTTGINLPNCQWNVNLRIKIRENVISNQEA